MTIVATGQLGESSRLDHRIPDTFLYVTIFEERQTGTEFVMTGSLTPFAAKFMAMIEKAIKLKVIKFFGMENDDPKATCHLIFHLNTPTDLAPAEAVVQFLNFLRAELGRQEMQLLALAELAGIGKGVDLAVDRQAQTRWFGAMANALRTTMNELVTTYY